MARRPIVLSLSIVLTFGYIPVATAAAPALPGESALQHLSADPPLESGETAEMWDGLGLNPSAFGAGEIPGGSAEPPTGVHDDVENALKADGQAEVIIRLSDQADLVALEQEAEQRARATADAERRGRATPHEAAEAALAARASTVRALGTGEYAVTADVVINGVRYQLPGPLLSP